MSESEPPLSTQEVVSHVVPIEQALEELQSVLDVIDSPSENDVVTRSGGVRCVKDVATVSSDILPVSTRSGETNDVENLFYIVNFEEENGYAILGADNRLESVYAIVDEGSLTPEELQQAVTISDGEAEANGELTFPLKMVVQAAATGIGGPIGGIGVRDPFDPNKPAPTLIRVEKTPIVYDYHLPMQKMLCCSILLMFNLLQRLKICWGTNWGRNFAGQKKKRANIKSLFIPYRRLCLPKVEKINVICTKGQL